MGVLAPPSRQLASSTGLQPQVTALDSLFASPGPPPGTLACREPVDRLSPSPASEEAQAPVPAGGSCSARGATLTSEGGGGSVGVGICGRLLSFVPFLTNWM